MLNASFPVSVETGVDLSRSVICTPCMLEVRNQDRISTPGLRRDRRLVNAVWEVEITTSHVSRTIDGSWFQAGSN